jgi:hypothetical protein
MTGMRDRFVALDLHPRHLVINGSARSDRKYIPPQLGHFALLTRHFQNASARFRYRNAARHLGLSIFMVCPRH